MRSTITYTIGAGLLIIASAVAVNAAMGRNREPVPLGVPEGADIPRSIKTEHEAIHQSLVAATKAPGAVGQAARDLAAVLHPHFVREEQVALSPLGALRPLAADQSIANPEAIAAMSDSLRLELPRMLEEHGRIRRAVEALRAAAVRAGATDVIELADDLALHALTEEEVLYPAAILVGTMLKRQTPR